MGIRREQMTPGQRQTELQQIQEIRAWINSSSHSVPGQTIRSGDMGGHVELKQAGEVRIGPSKEFVKELLESCGRKLGIDYVD